MTSENSTLEGIEISPRFRETIEERIARLDQGADYDEAQLELIEHPDHIRRQKHLIFVQRAEALRMRIFLDSSRTRLPKPLIVL